MGAAEIIAEVRYQFANVTNEAGMTLGDCIRLYTKEKEHNENGVCPADKEVKPDSDKCVEISTRSSVQEMIAPGVGQREEVVREAWAKKEGAGPAKGVRRRRHCRRPVQGHVGASAQHSDQAHVDGLSNRRAASGRLRLRLQILVLWQRPACHIHWPDAHPDQAQHPHVGRPARLAPQGRRLPDDLELYCSNDCPVCPKRPLRFMNMDELDASLSPRPAR